MTRNTKIAVYVGAFACAVAFVTAAAFGLIPAMAAGAGSLLALTIPPTLTSRNSGEQQLHFFRYRLQFASLSALTAGVKIGRLPARAFIHGVSIHTVTSFNAGTTATIALGSTSGGADILAATDIKAAGASSVAVPFAGSGLAVTGSGEVDLWAKFAQTGGAATTGDATLVLTYIPDNDQ